MNNNEPRIKRTYSCYSLGQIQDQVQADTGDLSPQLDRQRGSHEAYHAVQMEEAARMGYSWTGKTSKRRPTSPLSIVVCPDAGDNERTLLRLHWRETRGHQSEEAPTECCQLCHKRRELHSTWNRSEENGGKKYKAIFTGGKLASVWEYTGTSPRLGSRILPQQQEEDRGLLYMDPEEEKEIRDFLAGDTDYSDAWIAGEYGPDTPVAEQQSVERAPIRDEGALYPWTDPDGEDFFGTFLGEDGESLYIASP